MQEPRPLADVAIVNATIMPMGGGATIRDGALTISGNTIVALGPSNGIDVSGARRCIDARGGS